MQDDEQLLRRFNCSTSLRRQLASGAAVPVQKFRPRKPTPEHPGDVDGLSVNREECLRSSVEMVTCLRTDPERPQEHGIARFPLAALAQGSMTLQPAPRVGGPAGHCVIPELNCNIPEDQEEIMALVLQKAATCLGVFRAGSGEKLQ